MSSPKPRRRWYQFGLSTLLIGLTLFSLPLGYIAWEREQCRRGEAAIRVLDQNVLSTIPKHLSDPRDRVARTPSHRTGWLKALLGDDRFRLIETAVLHGDSVSDSDVQHLEAFPNLQDVMIVGPNVTDKGILCLCSVQGMRKFNFVSGQKTSAESWEVLGAWHQLQELSFHAGNFGDDCVPKLAPLTNLQELCLSNTKITDVGVEGISSLQTLEDLDLSFTDVTDVSLRHVGRLTNLQTLILGGTKVQGTGLNHLAALPKLKSLGLFSTQVTDDGLAQLAELTNLEGLGLSDTKVTDSGLAHLAGLSNLERLSLAKTRITDNGLLHLKRLTKLVSLDLSRTKITDAGMLHLRHLTNLKALDLHGTEVTASSAVELQKALPKASIGYPKY